MKSIVFAMTHAVVVVAIFLSLGAAFSAESTTGQGERNRQDSSDSAHDDGEFRVYGAVGNVMETDKHAGDFKTRLLNSACALGWHRCETLPSFCLAIPTSELL